MGVASPFSSIATREGEIKAKVIQVLEAVQMPFLADLDATRTGDYGGTLGFAALDKVRLAAQERAEFVLGVSWEDMDLPELDKSVRQCVMQYVNGLHQILTFPKTVDVEKKTLDATADPQRGQAQLARTAFLLSVSCSDALYTQHALEKMAAFETELENGRAALAGLQATCDANQTASEERMASIETQMEVIDIPALQGLQSGMSIALQDAEAFTKRVDDGIADATASLRADILKKSVAKHAGTFKKQADNNGWIAIGSGVAALVIVGWAALWGKDLFTGDFLTSGKELTGNEATRKIVADVAFRVLILSFVFSAFQLARRIFTAQAHLWAVNRHRQLSLQSFEQFYDEASDPEAKSAVLIATTRAIFEQTQTGFLGKAESAKPSSPIQDLVKLILPSSKADG